MEKTETIIKMEDVRKIYPMGEFDVKALDGVSLKVEKGEYLSLIGSSGSGKSTLLNLIGCLDRPTTGRYLIDNRDVSTLDRDERAKLRREMIGFVFQNFNLLTRTTATENVELPLMYGARITDQERRARALAALKQVGLADRVGHTPAQLSGGQQQRVAIARALVTNPLLLLADEPTGNIDSRSGAEILAILESLNSAGTTLIVVTHDLAVAARAPRQVTMLDGLITEDTNQMAEK